MLDVKHLSISFKRYHNSFRQGWLTTISDLSLSVSEGKMVAVVGASGAGKSLMAHAIMGILPPNATVTEEIYFIKKLLTQQRKKRLRGREITLVPQSVGFLNPLVRVGSQLIRAAKLAGVDRASLKDAVAETIKRYGLFSKMMECYPFQLSGGMARRVLIAMATVGEPMLIIADEPTSGLDEETAEESLGWLRYLADRGKGILLITHDIEAALKVVDTVVVLHAGTTVEIAAAGDFQPESNRLRHPYSHALWQALPRNGFCVDPAPADISAQSNGGCSYAGHCRLAESKCLVERPLLRRCNEGKVRCLHSDATVNI